ncbi:MAG TPA: hypothetical protein GX711_03145 [Clostridia bacterium]|nr:hypothetical protein [Clostridia bacterium]
MMTSSLFIVLALAVVAIIIIIAGIRLQPDKGGEDVIRNVYIYLVLFATLMMTIGGSVGAFMAIADIIAPAPYYQTFEEFQRWGNEKVYPDREDANEEKLSQEELKTRYDAMVRAEKARQINRAKNNLIKSFGWIMVPLPVFIYFQRRLPKKEAD